MNLSAYRLWRLTALFGAFLTGASGPSFGQDNGVSSAQVQASVSLRQIVSIQPSVVFEFGDLADVLAANGVLTIGADGQFTIDPQSFTSVPLPANGQFDVTGANGTAVDIACDFETLLADSDDFFSLNVLVSQGIADAATACSGLDEPVLTVSQDGPSPISVGGQVNLPIGIQTVSEEELDALQRDAAATFLAIFQ